jgi:hypothetical protein
MPQIAVQRRTDLAATIFASMDKILHLPIFRHCPMAVAPGILAISVILPGRM